MITPIVYNYPDVTGGDPFETMPISQLIHRDDKDILPAYTITDEAAGVQYLCWYYIFKGVETWKICRITTTSRSVIIAGSGGGPVYHTIQEQVVEYPSGYPTYNFDITNIFMYSYGPQRI